MSEFISWKLPSLSPCPAKQCPQLLSPFRKFPVMTSSVCYYCLNFAQVVALNADQAVFLVPRQTLPRVAITWLVGRLALTATPSPAEGMGLFKWILLSGQQAAALRTMDGPERFIFVDAASVVARLLNIHWFHCLRVFRSVPHVSLIHYITTVIGGLGWHWLKRRCLTALPHSSPRSFQSNRGRLRLRAPSRPGTQRVSHRW